MESVSGMFTAGYLPEYLSGFVEELDEHPWLFAALASMLVGLSGILPLLIIPIDETASFKDGDEGIEISHLNVLTEYSLEKLFPKIGERLTFMQKITTLLNQEVWAGCSKGKNRESSAGRGILLNRYYNFRRKLLKVGAISKKTIVQDEIKLTDDETASAATLRILLSFAVGGLLGDVFLHLLPEAWQHDLASTKDGEHVSMKCGLWCLFGMLVFIVVEKLFAGTEEEEKEEETPKLNGSVDHIEIEDIEKLLEEERKNRGKGKGEGICSNGTAAAKLYDTCVFNNNTKGEGVCCSAITTKNGTVRCKGNRWMGRCLLREAKEKTLKASKEKSEKKDVAGYLNLMANSIDNFTHGLAVGGSFLVGFRVGVLTTFAILVHEIPHEVGDFAILLKSGFSRWEAAKAQLATASAGLIGAMTAVIFSGARNAIEAKTSWIVPFTAGGFLHIALVTVLPDLLREEDKMESLKHLAALISGIFVMAFMTQYFG